LVVGQVRRRFRLSLDIWNAVVEGVPVSGSRVRAPLSQAIAAEERLRISHPQQTTKAANHRFSQ
jgi:hypothetical protein